LYYPADQGGETRVGLAASLAVYDGEAGGNVPWQIIAGCSFKHYQDHMPSIREWLAQRQERSQ